MKNDRMVAAVNISQPSEQVLVEPSSIHDGESEFSSESVNGRKHNTKLRALLSQFEMVDSSSHHDNLMVHAPLLF